MSARPYVEHVYSNLKSPRPGGDPWAIDLGPKTLLCGSNTSHKSSIIQSVELAISASADDVVGRSVVTDAALLLTLAPGDELGVTAKLSDGSVASYHARREEGKAKRPVHDGPGSSSLVHRSVADALSGSPATARKAFLQWCSQNINDEDVLSYLPTSVHSKYNDIAQHKGRGKSSTETLVEVSKYASTRSREITKEVKGAELIIDKLGDSLPPKPSDDDMSQIRFSVSEAREILDASIRAANAGMTQEEKTQKLNQLAEIRDAWEDNGKTATRQYEDLKKQLPHIGDNVKTAIQIVDVAVKHNLDQCPVCAFQVGLDHLKSCQSYYQNELSQWEQSSQTINQRIEEAQKKIESSMKNMLEAEQEIEKLNNTPAASVDGRALPVSEAQNRLETAMTALSKMEVDRSKWDDLTEAQKRVSDFELDKEAYKKLRSACDSAVSKLLADKTRDFSARVQNYLPPEWKFKIQLVEGGREVFRMGFEREGKLHCALSGAEWATVITAVSMAVTTSLPENAPAILIPYDRAWDARTLSSVMKGFLNYEGQVIIASTTRPLGRPPKGWTIIDMDKMSKSWVEGDESPEVEVKVTSVEQRKIKRQPVRKRVKSNGTLSVVSRSTQKLEAMGYRVVDICKMSQETGQYLLSNNIKPDSVVILDDGGYKPAPADNVLPIKIPPSPPTK
tara:strand:+ start:2530 stop:4560 length:2031 start_codon:yes stop_codon:yes gene_type:complete